MDRSMGAVQEKEWFYLSLGHKRGPVTKEEVCKKIEKQEVYVDSTKLWKNGMTQWLNLSDIQEFAPSIQKIKKTLARSEARVKQDTAVKGIDEDIVCRGASRLLFNIYFYVGWMIPLLIGAIVLTELQVFQVVDAESVQLFWWLKYLPVILAVWATCSICGHRMQNAGYSRVIGWTLLVPLYNIWVLFVSLFAPQNFKRRKKMGPSILVYAFLLLGMAAVLSPVLFPKLTFQQVSPLVLSEKFQNFYAEKTNASARYEKWSTTQEENEAEREQKQEAEQKAKEQERAQNPFGDKKGEWTTKRGL